MNTQLVWRSPEPPIDPVSNHQVIVENRLSSLRDVALTLLREVEALRVVEPIRHRLRLHDEVQRFEIALITSALNKSRGNQTMAAQILGVKLTTLNSKIKRYKLSLDEYSGHNELTLRENVA